MTSEININKLGRICGVLYDIEVASFNGDIDRTEMLEKEISTLLN